LTTSGVCAKMPHPVMTKKVPIVSDRAPRVANQTQAVRCDNLVYVSGQIGCDPVTGILAEGLEAQTERMLANLDAVLAVANCSKENIVAVTMMFSDMQYFKRADEIYAAWSPSRETIPLPVRRAFASKHLPGGALVQIEAVAAVS
jgi:2-iminobutanoate/2-iminopropanoate deaminase